MSKYGIVNVKMVITEEKILSNIDKITKLINPKSKKQIIQLDEDAYFKDLIESVKLYLLEYPKKKNFPPTVYKASYDLVEYATSQFEDNTKLIEKLIRQRENNIALAGELKGLVKTIVEKDKDWKAKLKAANGTFGSDIMNALVIIAKAKDKEDEAYKNAKKLVKARIANLETNLHIEIDMERIEDRSKALSYIGIEVAEALKTIPTPQALTQEGSVAAKDTVTAGVTAGATAGADTTADNYAAATTTDADYYNETRVEVKPSLWQRIKNTKFVRALGVLTKIRIKLDVPALGDGSNNN